MAAHRRTAADLDWFCIRVIWTHLLVVLELGFLELGFLELGFLELGFLELGF